MRSRYVATRIALSRKTLPFFPQIKSLHGYSRSRGEKVKNWPWVLTQRQKIELSLPAGGTPPSLCGHTGSPLAPFLRAPRGQFLTWCVALQFSSPRGAPSWRL